MRNLKRTKAEAATFARSVHALMREYGIGFLNRPKLYAADSSGGLAIFYKDMLRDIHENEMGEFIGSLPKEDIEFVEQEGI